MNATPHQGNKNTGDTKNNRPAEDTNQRTTDPQENAKRATESVQAKVAEAASNPEVNASPQDVAQENSQLAVTGERREEVEDDVDPRPSRRMQDGQRGVADAAGGTGARSLSRIACGVSQGLGKDIAESDQGGVELGHVLLGGALLRAEDRGGTALAGERVVHVRREDELGLGDARMQSGEIYGGQLREGGAAVGNL